VGLFKRFYSSMRSNNLLNILYKSSLKRNVLCRRPSLERIREFVALYKKLSQRLRALADNGLETGAKACNLNDFF